MKKNLFIKQLERITVVFIILMILMCVATPIFIYVNGKYKIINTTETSKTEDIF